MSKSEDIYLSLRKQIREEELLPGYHLVVESLARAHGVSALPVREALRRLQAEGLVSYGNHVGAKVRPVDFLQEAQLVEALGVLEGWILALGARTLTRTQCQEWRGYVQDLAQIVERRELPAFYSGHHKITTLWEDACPNRAAVFLGEEVAARISHGTKNIVLWSPQTADATVLAHYEILQSVSEGALPNLTETLVRDLFLCLATAIRTVKQQPVAPSV